ncbi:MAG: hypothetical protein RLZZ618_3305 [Pseudomonadota bacterium]
MPTIDETKVPTGISKLWLLSCALLCAAIVAYSLSGERMVSGDLSYQLGYNLAVAAFLAGLLHLLFRRKQAAWTGALGFALIFAALFGGAMSAMRQQKADLGSAVSDIEKAVAGVQSSVASGTATPAPIPTGGEADTAAGRMGALLKKMVNTMLAQRREYEAELDAIGWSQILDAQRIQNDPQLTATRDMLRRGKEIVARYRQKTREIFPQMRQDIEAASLDSETRRGMLTGFDKSTERGQAQADEVWGLEEQVLSQIEDAANFLGQTRSAWQVDGGQVAFHRQADLDSFNALMAKVQATIAQQEQLQSASLRKAKDSLQKLKD